ncbi:MAG: efflux RND transporter permease subunit [Clostridium sp.]|nr:efflux RND transporter permease subunit [Clostridium sp.]
MVIKFGKWLTRHKAVVLIIAFLLLIPATIGYVSTRINYDLLSYLPNSLETVSGQDTMVDEFGMGAFSMIVVEDMEKKDIVALKEKLKKVNHVEDVIWYDDAMDITVPTEMLPDKLREGLFNGNATMMIALFDNTTSADLTMDAITEMRGIVKKQAFISGMSGVVTDIKNLAMAEMPIYVVVAAVLSLLILLLTMDSLVTPVIFLLGIGMAIVYNMGTNMVFGEISYITQALTAILQLGVTMDYSIFLLESYEANKVRYDGDKNRAMAHAISNTFTSVTSSSVTTIAGFAALCFMTFKLGMDLGLVMAKGVIIGVIVCLTVLPALILCFDKAIDKTTHKNLIPNLDGLSKKIVKGWPVVLVLFLVLLGPAMYGNSNYKIYYDIAGALPQSLDSAVANKKLEEKFNMNSTHIVLMKNGMASKEKSEMLKKIEDVKGVKWALGIDSFKGVSIPSSMIPKKLESKLKSDNYEIAFVCSDYKAATDKVNSQIADINKIVKKYSKDSMVIGEAPLTKDLQDVTDIDLVNVNYVSVAAIFLIILITFKSILIPVILVMVIEFAIFLNMSVPFYTHESLPFVASIVIGTIQLGATVDYAILMTSRYHKERVVRRKSKKEAIDIAHKTSIKSIMISGMCLFASTFGVTMSSSIDMIKSICTLLSRGAVISTIVVILVLPAMLTVFDKWICKTTWDMRKIDY